MQRITEYTATTTLAPDDVTDWSIEVTPGNFATRKITYADFLLEIYADLDLGDAFIQGGNSFGDTATIGTIDNEELSFITNATEKMKITTDGTVIINNINNAIALVVFADGFTPVSISQTDAAGNASSLSVENFSEIGNISAGSFVMRNTITDASSTALNLIHLLTTTDAGEDGIGIGVNYFADTDDEQTQLMGGHRFEWYDAQHSARTARLIINTVNLGVAADIFEFHGHNIHFRIAAGGDQGDGDGIFYIHNAATVPTGTPNPIAGGVLYAEAGALKWRGSGGTVTTLGPA